MSDRKRPDGRSDPTFDARLRRLAADASSDAPPAPPFESFSDVTTHLHPAQTDGIRSRRWITGGAIVLGTAAADASFIVLNDNPTETIAPATVPTTTATAPTTALDELVATEPNDGVVTTDFVATPLPSAVTIDPQSTTTVPPKYETAVGFTPVLLESPVGGYALDFAVSTPTGDGKRAGYVRYRNDQPDSPAIELIIRDVPDSFLDSARESGRQTWKVNGRTVYDDNELDGCSPDHCSVGLQWDETTNVSVTWNTRDGGTLGPEHTIESLIDLVAGPDSVPGLREVEPDAFRTVVIPIASDFAPTLSRRGVIVAGPDGVIAFDGWVPEPVVLTTEPAVKATGLPDGRVIVQRGYSVGPDDLFILDPSNDHGTDVVPYWPAAVPDDGMTSIDIEDAATIDGVQTLLLQVATGEVNNDGTGRIGTVEVVAFGDESTGRKVIADFGGVELGLFPKGFVDVDLRKSEPQVGGIFYDRFDEMPFFASLDGERDTFFEQSVIQGQILSIGLDPDGYLVSQVVDGPIVIRDETADAFVEIPVETAFFPNVQGSPELEPTLTRESGVRGSVWARVREANGSDSWVEIDVDGNELNRMDGGATVLTATNR